MYMYNVTNTLFNCLVIETLTRGKRVDIILIV